MGSETRRSLALPPSLSGAWVGKEMVTWGRGQAFCLNLLHAEPTASHHALGRGMYEDCRGLRGGECRVGGDPRIYLNGSWKVEGEADEIMNVLGVALF